MFANITFRFSLFPLETKSPETKVPKKVQAPVTVSAAQSERMILIDRICNSWGTRYRDLVKYRAL